MVISQYIGDSKTCSIPLKWKGRAFTPGADWVLLFTVKTSVDVADAAALIQKQTGGYGITVTASTASVAILRADTFREADYPDPGDLAFEATAGDYVWDIKAVALDDGETRTVASGILQLTRPVGLLTEATQTIYTTEDPLVSSAASVAAVVHAATSKESPVDADEIPLMDSAASWGLKKLTWANLKATAKTYFDTLYEVTGAAAIVQAFAIQRANHTGTQAHTTITGLGNAATMTVDADLSTFSLPASTTISTFGASLIDDTSATAARTTLGLGTAATRNTGTTSGTVLLLGPDGSISTNANGAGLTLEGANSPIVVLGAGSYISTGDYIVANGFIRTKTSLQLDNNTYTTTLQHAPTDNRGIFLPDASGTLALTSDLSSYLPLTGGAISGNLNVDGGVLTLGVNGVADGSIILRGAISGFAEISVEDTSGTLQLNSVTITSGGVVTASSIAASGVGAVVSTSNIFQYNDGSDTVNLAFVTSGFNRIITFPDETGTLALTSDTAPTATAALGLKTATTTVSVSSSTAPTSGQVLTATNGTTATWQTPSSGALTGAITTSGTVASLGSFTLAQLNTAVSDADVAPIASPSFTGELNLSGQSLTGSQATSLSSLATTWNTTGTPTAITLNVTDTASNAASLLMDLRVGGASRMSVSKAGNIALANSSITGVSNITMNQYLTGAVGIWAANTGTIGWSDAQFNRDGAANTIAQRNGTNAQTSRLYNTFTARGSGTTNLEALETKATAAGSFIIQSLKGNIGGTARDIEFRHGATDTNGTITNGTLAMTVTSAGISIAQGTAADPSVSFSGDTNTGFYGGGADILGFSTNGTTRGTISATGTWTFEPGTSATNGVFVFGARNGSTLINAIQILSSQGGGGEIFFTASSKFSTAGSSNHVFASGSGGTALMTINGSTGTLTLQKTVTSTGTTGAQTINRPTGRVNFAAGATSLVVTNSACTVDSIIHCTMATNDSTASGIRAVAAAGSFTIHMLVAPTAETAVNFLLTN